MKKYIGLFLLFLGHIVKNHKLIKTLIVNDFKKNYFGSYLGLVWAFAQPLTYMLIIWIVFSSGLRSANLKDGTPFFLWLMSGMIPWFFISSTLSSTTNAIVSNSFLVKKVAFRVSILPLIPIGSAFIIHFILIIVLILSFLLYGYTASIYWLELIYYIICSIFLMLGVGWIFSSIRVFVKDISNFIILLVQIGFWITPIFWHIESISKKHRWIVQLNPAEYIVTGYRDTFINHIWFWEKSKESLYFLAISSILFILGAFIFRQLRPHFGDVL